MVIYVIKFGIPTRSTNRGINILKQDCPFDSKLNHCIEKSHLNNPKEAIYFLLSIKTIFLKTTADEPFLPCTDLINWIHAACVVINIH